MNSEVLVRVGYHAVEGDYHAHRVVENHECVEDPANLLYHVTKGLNYVGQ